MGEIQAKSGEIPTIDDAMQELLNSYKNKSKNKSKFLEENSLCNSNL